jgi:hypothetical protein
MKGLLLYEAHSQYSQKGTVMITVPIVKQLLNQLPMLRGQYTERLEEVLGELPDNFDILKAEAKPEIINEVVRTILLHTDSMYRHLNETQIQNHVKDIAKCFKTKPRDNIIRNAKDFAIKQWGLLLASLSTASEQFGVQLLVTNEIPNYNRKYIKTEEATSTTLAN